MTSRREFITHVSGVAAGAGLVFAQAQPAEAQQAASTAAAAAKSKLDEVRARGKVIVGVTSEAPPFGFIDDKGELVGFDIDVAKLIAKGIFGDETKIELFKQGFATRWPNAQNGTIDFGIMVTTVYADRALQVAFTRPYIDSGIVVVVKKDSPVKSIADLNKAENTVAHLTAPVQEERGKRHPNAIVGQWVEHRRPVLQHGEVDPPDGGHGEQQGLGHEDVIATIHGRGGHRGKANEWRRRVVGRRSARRSERARFVFRSSPP